jgi:hypothetical protein
MSRRLGKQLVYGFLYIALLGGFMLVVYILFFNSGASCTNERQDPGEEGIDCGKICGDVCIPEDFKPIRAIGPVQVFRPSASLVELIAKVQNSNLALSARSFDYKFEIKDVDGSLVDTISGTSYIYNGEVKYIVAIKTGVSYRAAAADFEASNPSWVKADEFYRPEMSGVLDKQIAVGSTTINISGAVINKDITSVDSIGITALMRDQYGILLGVSQTVLGGLDAGERKQFSMQHPVMPGIVPDKTEIIINAEHP